MPGATSPPVVPYRYYNVIRNNGDAISAYILRDTLGVQGIFVEGSRPHLLPVGSIVFMATAQSHIWGSGILNPAWTVPPIDPRKIHALRGTRTRDHLRGLGLPVPEVPLGDPAILVGKLVERDVPTRFRAAVVPHHGHWGSKRYERFAHDPDFCLVDMMDDSLAPLERIAESDVVISQSLHGLIFAEALGKPSLWISDVKTEAWTFKFHDWFSTTRNPQREPAPLDLPVDEMIRRAERRHAMISAADLIAAFPRVLVTAGGENRTGFAAARPASPLVARVTAAPPAAGGAEAEGGAFLAWLRQERRHAFRDFAEPTYLALVLGEGGPPGRADLLAGQRHLDSHRGHDGLWFAPQRPAGAPFAVEDAAALPPVAVLASGTLLLRPSGQFSTGAHIGLPC
jgi:hypothetical protein